VERRGAVADAGAAAVARVVPMPMRAAVVVTAGRRRLRVHGAEPVHLARRALHAAQHHPQEGDGHGESAEQAGDGGHG
jgi:hypothetical protein